MEAAEEQTARFFLRRCAAIYEALVARVLQLEALGDDEETLKWLGLAAGIAAVAHPGRFADERLERVARQAGQRLQSPEPVGSTQIQNTSHDTKVHRRVLHVATTVFEIGGHTRLIENWIKNDAAALHSLVLLDQRQHAVRTELVRGIGATGGELILLPADCSKLDRSRRLRQVATSGYDCIILHQHPDDLVPSVAMATTNCPPVAVMNHADHVFWLGISVADAVIDSRQFGARLSRERRGARQSLMLPLPLDLTRPALDRAEARARLGIPVEEVMLLSIGSAYKYTPTKTHNFFRTLDQVLADNPTARLYLVGVGADDFRSFGAPRHERIEPLGIVGDPSLYEAAADLYLEGFPYGSYTALIETAARGVCPVLLYAPTPQSDTSGDAGLKGLITSAADEADYVARVTFLINNPDARSKLGRAVAHQIDSTYASAGFRKRLKAIYEKLAATTHLPGPLPAQPSFEFEEDLNLARFNNARIKGAVIQQISTEARADLTVGDLSRLFLISLRFGDTRLTPAHIRGWLSLLRSTIFPRRARPIRAKKSAAL